MIGSLLLGLTLAQQSSLPFLSPTFGDHMVLQRDRPNTFWGWSAPGTAIKVSVAAAACRSRPADWNAVWKCSQSALAPSIHSLPAEAVWKASKGA